MIYDIGIDSLSLSLDDPRDDDGCMHVCRRRSRCSEVCGCRRVDRFVRDSLIRSLAFPCRKKKSVSVVETNSLSLSFVLNIIKQPHHSLTLLLLKSKLPLFFFSFVLVRLASPFPFRFFIPSAFWLEVGTLFGCAFRKKKNPGEVWRCAAQVSTTSALFDLLDHSFSFHAA